MVRFMVRSVILLGLLTATAFGQVTFDFTGVGARARAMGGAFIGVSDDISASTWNPAGLQGQDETKLGLEVGSFLPRGTATDFRNFLDQDGSFGGVNYLAIQTPVRFRGQPFVLSASYARLFEDHQGFYKIDVGTYSQDFFGQPMASPETVTTVVETENHSAPYAINLAFGTPLSDALSFGFGAEVYLGEQVVNVDEVDILENYPDPSGFPQTETVLRTLTVRDTATFSGIGLKGGLMYRGEDFGVGLLVRAPLSFNASNDSKVFQIVEFAGLPIPGVSDTTFFDDQLTKYDLPIMIGLGLSYNVTDRLLLATDIEYRGFSGRIIKVRVDRNITNDTETFVEQDPEWENTLAVRAGGEYLWETGAGAFPVVPLRLGFAYTPIPTPNAERVYTNGIPNIDFSANQSYSVSGGFGLQWSQIKLDFAWSHRILEIQQVLPIVSFEGVPGLWPVKSDNKSHDFMITFTGVF